VLPVSPAAPVLPVVPAAPVLPVVPAAPVLPVSPAAPVFPVVPAEPVLPVVPPVPVAASGPSAPPSVPHEALVTCTQTDRAELQLSMVHASASSQSLSTTQHGEIAACAHEWVATTQVSVVQELASPH
jgi:hypothetical protein